MSLDISFDQVNDSLHFQGELTSQNVMSALNRLIKEYSHLGNWVIDFSNVSKVDSTAVALLIELKKFAREKNKPVSFLHLPTSLMTIARLSQLEDFLIESS